MSNRRTIKKLTNQRHCVSRSFFHQPMSRACDDLFLHVDRYITHDHSLHGTERRLSTYRHHRHSQLRLFKDLVVVRIGRESGELSEPGAHPTWSVVSGSKDIAGGLVSL